jgi:hypothetical protein
MLTEEQLKNYWDKVDVKGEDECWNWTACLVDGYGHYWIRFGEHAKHYKAHRVSAYTAGLIPNINSQSNNDQVLHTCDNRKCQNPNHFFIGSNADNMRDRDNKGRHISHKGETNTNSKLTEQDVIEIRGLYAVGTITQYALANVYGVAQSTINRIINREKWAHL